MIHIAIIRIDIKIHIMIHIIIIRIHIMIQTIIHIMIHIMIHSWPHTTIATLGPLKAQNCDPCYGLGPCPDVESLRCLPKRFKNKLLAASDAVGEDLFW